MNGMKVASPEKASSRRGAEEVEDDHEDDSDDMADEMEAIMKDSKVEASPDILQVPEPTRSYAGEDRD